MKHVVILGAGTAGSMMANHLHHHLQHPDWEITIDEIPCCSTVQTPGPLLSSSLAAPVYLFNNTGFSFVTFVTKQAVAEIYFCSSKKIK